MNSGTTLIRGEREGYPGKVLFTIKVSSPVCSVGKLSQLILSTIVGLGWDREGDVPQSYG